MQTTAKKPFIPRNKPKTWVIGVLSGVIGLLVAGPIMFLGIFLKIKIISGFGMVLFFLCWLTFACVLPFYFFGFVSGKYRDLEEKEWSKQVW